MWRRLNNYLLRPSPLLLVLIAAFASTHAPSILAAKAKLPTANEVRPGKRSSFDGEYRISTLNKRILLDRGRMIVLDGWKHLFIWSVEPGMVVVRDIRRVGRGEFVGYDLPMDGEWRATYDYERDRFSVTVTNQLGAFGHELFPVDADADDDWEDRDKDEAEQRKDRRIKAKRRGDAVLPIVTSCPGKQSYLSNGACWVCPKDYKRAKLTREMDHPKACEKRKTWGKGPYKPAKRKSTAGARCPTGQFHVAEKGVNGCYTCPRGYRRDTSTRNSAMCMLRDS